MFLIEYDYLCFVSLEGGLFEYFFSVNDGFTLHRKIYPLPKSRSFPI